MFSPQQYRAAREAAGLLERPDRGRLRLTGADRRSYLQGLLTNDIAALNAGEGCYAAFLTAQGRMIADMRVWELGDAILMDLDAGVAAAVRDRFDQFIFSEDVQVADVTSELVQFGAYGPAASTAIARAVLSGATPGEPTPDASSLEALRPFESRRWDFGGPPVFTIRSDELGIAGFDLFIEQEHAATLASALRASGVVDLSPETAEVLRIEAGRPAFHKDMDEDTIPLEAGIEGRAISLTKGCYVGQEIIIRVLHRGHGRVARRLVGLIFDPAADVPAAGTKLKSGDRDIGAITSAAASPALVRPIALGYVHRDFTEPGTAVTAGDLPAVVTALPFAGGQTGV